MKYSAIIISMIILQTIVFQDFAMAGGKVAKSGIGFRGSYWNMNNDGHFTLRVRENDGYTDFDIGGFGGSLYFFSRVSDQVFMDFSIGAVASVEGRSYDFFAEGDHADVMVVMPITMGFRVNLIPISSGSALEPYFSAGAGAYWLSDIRARDIDTYEEEVIVHSSTKPGAYAGGGFNFMFTKGFGLNYDMRYHWIDFQTEEFNSGLEFSFGLIIAWGTHK